MNKKNYPPDSLPAVADNLTLVNSGPVSLQSAVTAISGILGAMSDGSVFEACRYSDTFEELFVLRAGGICATLHIQCAEPTKAKKKGGARCRKNR